MDSVHLAAPSGQAPCEGKADLRSLALAATPGPWEYAGALEGLAGGKTRVVEYFIRRPGDNIAIAADVMDPDTGTPSEANAAYIAAANPARILALLDERDRLRSALEEIAEGCIARRPGHADAHRNRTKEQIEAIARAALKETSE